MLTFITLLVVIAAAVFAAGLYFGWFSLSTRSKGAKSAVTVSLDKGKLEADKNKALKSFRTAAPKDGE